MKVRASLVLVCAAALFAAGAQAAGKTHAVRIEGMKFVPERLEVAAGDTVVWNNKDFLPHSVTASEARVESGTSPRTRAGDSSRARRARCPTSAVCTP